MHYKHICKGTCSVSIDFDLNDGVVSNIAFLGGCNGNLKAVSKLCEGKNAEDIVKLLKGNICGYKTTSCADQLAIALETALKQEN